MNPQDLIALRAQKDHFFRTHEQSPLTDAQKALFTGLSYYVPQPNLALQVTVTRDESGQNVQIQTTQERPRWYMRYGWFEFTVGGQQVRLTIFFSPPNLYFLPFVDAGAGTETYPAGRYLEPVPLGDDQFGVDFNQAYNPYCAYNDRWDCPITPAENRLTVAVPAGEKLPTGEWVGVR